MTTLNYKQKLLRTTEIQNSLVDSSKTFDEQTRQHFKHLSKYIKDILAANPNANSYQLKTLANELLRYWNESINHDTEKFWKELQINDIDFERKEPLKFALTKKRFSNVEQSIDAKNNWADLKKLNLITDRFSNTEIEQIENIIADDENKRLDILKKCLTKKLISPTQYLKFGECMAYFNNCRLFDKYFTTAQVKELYDIWKSFKAE